MRVLQTREVLPATPRTRIIRLDLAGAEFPFRAGQAVLVGLRGSALRKPYSIACSPRQARELNAIELLVQVDESDTTSPHLERAAPGTVLDVDGPFGTFSLPSPLHEREILFVAGGTGIAPLRAMLWDTLDHPGKVSRLALVYSARSADEFAYADELRQLADENRVDVRFTITREAAAWTGNRGRVSALLIQSVLRTRDTRCVLCGPPGMVTDTMALLQTAGVPADKILTESFAT